MPTTSHDWGFMSEPDERGRSVPLPRGRLMGGCSATNACFALRGWPLAGELSPLQRAFADAAVAAGHRLVGDHNEPGTVGAGPAPRNVRDGLRMSTALTHLAATRGRPNLAIRAGAAVDRVELHGTTARGVRTVGGEIIEG